MKPVFGIISFMVLFSSCIVFKFSEEEVFDVKRTINLESFHLIPYRIDEVWFNTSDGVELQGFYIDNPNSDKTVLYFGGSGFVIATSYDIINSIIEQGIDLFVFNYRGYGRNTGIPTLNGIKLDGLAAYDYLRVERKISPENLILQGHSLGSFLASYIANQRESAALILENPVTDLKDWIGTSMPWYVKPFLKFDLDSALQYSSTLDEIEYLDIPLLIITGSKDRITPKQIGKKLYRKAKTDKKQLLVIKKGGHNDLPKMMAYKKALAEFYKKHGREKKI